MLHSKQFAIIGCRHNHIGSFIREMKELGYGCAGVYDPDEPSLARAFSEKFGIRLADDPEPLWAPEVEVIGSSAVNNRKIDLIEECERRGKHIMLDKPIVTCRDGLNRLHAVMERGRTEIGMMLTSRDRPSIYTLKRKIEAGELGEIVSITMRKPHKLLPATRHDWHFSKERNGGIIIDLLIHDFDLLRWLTGQEVLEIHSFMAKNILPEYPDFYDTATAQVRMEGHVLAQLYTDWHTPEQCWAFGDCRIFVTGTLGSAELRVFGDPSVSMDELMFKITHREAFQRVDLLRPETTVTADFLQRIRKQPHAVTHRDIYLACKATVDADEQAVILK